MVYREGGEGVKTKGSIHSYVPLQLNSTSRRREVISPWLSKQTFPINLLQAKMFFTGETSTSEKDAKNRSETKNIQFFSYNVYFVF